MSTKPAQSATPADRATIERFVPLRGKQVRRLKGAARLRITHGTVWLTVSGEIDDHLLQPGEAFALDRGQDAMVQAMSERACIVAVEPVPSWMQRAASALQAASQRVAEAFA